VAPAYARASLVVRGQRLSSQDLAVARSLSYISTMTETPTYNFQYDESVAEFAVSKSAYLRTHPNAAFKLVATAALVLDTSLPTPRILLLQRAANDSHPGKWEPPGGAVDDEDLTILHAAARELWEEASLQASHISGPVGGPHFFPRSNGDQICRFSFAVHVLTNDGAALSAKLDPNEHQSYVWATEEEVRAGRAGAVDLEFVKEEVKRTVLLAFIQAHDDSAQFVSRTRWTGCTGRHVL
jgi:8-oxo-dGTP pyrophosphatase MutT (NUDIX family)